MGRLRRVEADYLAYWVDDLDQNRRELEAQGIPVCLDGRAVGNPAFNYHQAPRSGLRLEPVDRSLFEAFQAAIAQGSNTRDAEVHE